MLSSNVTGFDPARRGYHAVYRDNELLSQSAARLMQFTTTVRIEDHLSLAIPVTQIDKDQPTQVTPGVHPTSQRHHLTDMFFAKLTTRVCAFQSRHGR